MFDGGVLLGCLILVSAFSLLLFALGYLLGSNDSIHNELMAQKWRHKTKVWTYEKNGKAPRAPMV